MSEEKQLVVLDEVTEQAINATINVFDMNANLTEDELRMMGQVPDHQRTTNTLDAPHEIEEDKFAQNTNDVSSEADYNAEYAKYLKCQSVVTLVSFEDGWTAFQELILRPFLREQQRANKEYRGTDPFEGSALRIRQQTAEDLFVFIDAVIEDVKAFPKPVLKQQK